MQFDKICFTLNSSEYCFNAVQLADAAAACSTPIDAIISMPCLLIWRPMAASCLGAVAMVSYYRRLFSSAVMYPNASGSLLLFFHRHKDSRHRNHRGLIVLRHETKFVRPLQVNSRPYRVLEINDPLILYYHYYCFFMKY